MAKSKNYTVLKEFTFGDEVCEVGSVLELSLKEAKPFLEDNFIEEVNGDIETNPTPKAINTDTEVAQDAITYAGKKILGGVEDVMLKGMLYKRFVLENGSGFTVPVEEFTNNVNK